MRIRGAETRWRDLEEDGSKWKKERRGDKDAQRNQMKEERGTSRGLWVEKKRGGKMRRREGRLTRKDEEDEGRERS